VNKAEKRAGWDDCLHLINSSVSCSEVTIDKLRQGCHSGKGFGLVVRSVGDVVMLEEEEGKGVEGSGLAFCRYVGWDGCVPGFVLGIGAQKCNAYEGYVGSAL